MFKVQNSMSNNKGTVLFYLINEDYMHVCTTYAEKLYYNLCRQSLLFRYCISVKKRTLWLLQLLSAKFYFVAGSDIGITVVHLTSASMAAL